MKIRQIVLCSTVRQLVRMNFLNNRVVKYNYYSLRYNCTCLATIESSLKVNRYLKQEVSDFMSIFKRKSLIC